MMTCTKQQLETEGRHPPTVVSCRIVAVVIHDDPLTLCLAPFKQQIVLHMLLPDQKRSHCPLWHAGLHYLFKQAQFTTPHTDLGLFWRRHVKIHATCDSRGDMLNTLTCSVTQGSQLGNRRSLFPGARRGPLIVFIIDVSIKCWKIANIPSVWQSPRSHLLTCCFIWTTLPKDINFTII